MLTLTSKLVFIMILLFQVVPRLKTIDLKIPEYLQDGFTCPELETMEPISDKEYRKGTDDAFRVTFYLANFKQCYYKPEDSLGRIVLAPNDAGKKILGFVIQVREGPDFKRRIGWLNKISRAQTQCDEPGALTHQSITPRDEVQAQWYRTTLSLDGNEIMIKVTILGKDKWYSINITVADCETIDECHSNPCQNKGTCQDGINRYSCICVPRFTGLNCEKEIRESSPCKNGGICNEAVNYYTCKCTNGFTGLHCETENPSTTTTMTTTATSTTTPYCLNDHTTNRFEYRLNTGDISEAEKCEFLHWRLPDCYFPNITEWRISYWKQNESNSQVDVVLSEVKDEASCKKTPGANSGSYWRCYHLFGHDKGTNYVAELKYIWIDGDIRDGPPIRDSYNHHKGHFETAYLPDAKCEMSTL